MRRPGARRALRPVLLFRCTVSCFGRAKSRPLVFRRNLKLASEVSLVMRTTRPAKKIGPSVGPGLPVNCDGGVIYQYAPKLPFSTGGTSRDLAPRARETCRQEQNHYGKQRDGLPCSHTSE